MSQMFEKTAEINNTGMAQMMKGVSALSKTNQTAGIEMADFAKESLAAGAETMKKLAAARTPQAAMEIQGAYLKASFERLQAQAKVMCDLYDPKNLFDPKNFPKLPGLPAMTAPKLAA
jgi:hypothetical protein